MKAHARSVQLACYVLAPLYIGCGALLIQRSTEGWAETIALCWFGTAGILLVLGWTARDTTASAQPPSGRSHGITPRRRNRDLRVLTGGMRTRASGVSGGLHPKLDLHGAAAHRDFPREWSMRGGLHLHDIQTGRHRRQIEAAGTVGGPLQSGC